MSNGNGGRRTLSSVAADLDAHCATCDERWERARRDTDRMQNDIRETRREVTELKISMARMLGAATAAWVVLQILINKLL